ncbi:HD domain-containing protein [Bacillus sp. 31A1R]|uniref:HD domain-containing protein n=1 Tax=Robertmurraya mangrovi TaxID=3098077 RepID=A0ABU5J1I8_9BACI|nr:HD domain-containing protein [Bacillus sp. 31A1R]MDZ5473285.1 HD domain-containing protein [Bacillus sp. 31A1R]
MKEKALQFATKAHEGQLRKTTNTPMIEHPIRVAKTLESAGFKEEVVIAGYLHDTVEDTYVEFEDITREFGNEVTRIVAGNTENKDHSWEERKQHTIDHIKTAPLEIKALIVTDKLDNLKSLVEDEQRLGNDIWKSFKRGKEKQKWYFESVAVNMFEGLQTDEIPSFFYEYEQLVKDFF